MTGVYHYPVIQRNSLYDKKYCKQSFPGSLLKQDVHILFI